MKNDARIAPMIGSVQAHMQYYFAAPHAGRGFVGEENGSPPPC
jgi:hypothetical protein